MIESVGLVLPEYEVMSYNTEVKIWWATEGNLKREWNCRSLICDLTKESQKLFVDIILESLAEDK